MIIRRKKVNTDLLLASEKEAIRILNAFKMMFQILNQQYPGLKGEMCYCGITNDVDRRQKEHNATFLCVADCGDFQMASRVETLLSSYGFDAGAQQCNGTSDSKYAYLYIKTADTIEKPGEPDGKDPNKPYYQ